MKNTLFALPLVLALLSGAALAEVISAKYAGAIDLSSYSCQSTASSFLHRACYNRSEQTLVLLLKSTYYKYCSVPDSVSDGLLSASSKGSYFNSYIKGRYDC
ncbi:MAG: KTSC domain-containing protein [Halioglobus sp.]